MILYRFLSSLLILSFVAYYIFYELRMIKAAVISMFIGGAIIGIFTCIWCWYVTKTDKELQELEEKIGQQKIGDKNS